MQRASGKVSSSNMLTRLERVDGKTILVGANDGCAVPSKRVAFLNRFAESRKHIPTPAEKKMLSIIHMIRRCCDNTLRFRREVPVHFSDSIGRVADIVFQKQKLIIEIDGGYHTVPLQSAMDEWRDRLAAATGNMTLRFTNEEVMEHQSLAALKLIEALLSRGRLSQFNIKSLRELGVEIRSAIS